LRTFGVGKHGQNLPFFRSQDQWFRQAKGALIMSVEGAPWCIIYLALFSNNAALKTGFPKPDDAVS
jgi:hypothetical protein